MSKNISGEKNSHPVSSKYFSPKSAMDESLTDFQETKKLAGPQNTSKKAKPDKPKRAPKKIRGQRDIRKVLKSKKNELESYSKDFDNVCKQAGLDVDSEQLQLAIALSKSLQQSTTTGVSSETSQPLNTHDRVGNIRTTLLEYGFKVPDIKITTTKRLKKRKNYKLLLTSEEAKNQIISEKYSQVLFKNINLPRNFQKLDTDVTQIQLYNLATNATYSVLKSIDTFYVDGLLEKSTSTGNLLRDWSEIRGRPVSPKHCDPAIMNFSEIECSQEELDIVLSGSLKSCKNVIKRKAGKGSMYSYNFSEKKALPSANNLDNSVIVLIDDKNETLQSITTRAEDLLEPESINLLRTIDSEIADIKRPVAMVSQVRSCSPDLFDDEPSTVINEEIVTPPYEVPTELSKSYRVIKTNSKLQLSQDTNVSKECIDIMEITDCVEVKGLITNSAIKKSTLKLSQNVTKRNSNDFMEITNCVVSPAQLLRIESDIDLTTSPENIKCASESGEAATGKDKHNEASKQNSTVEAVKINEDTNIENINKNITHSSSENIPKVICINSNIDLTSSPDLEQINSVENKADRSIESLDLTQSSNTSDELPFVSLKNDDKAQPANDTIILDPKEYYGISKPLVSHDIDEVLDLTQNVMHGEQKSQNNLNDIDSRQVSSFEIDQNIHNHEDILDLTQEVVLTSEHNSRTSDTNTSFFKDFVHNHSDNNDEHNEIMHGKNINKNTSSNEIVLSDIIDKVTDFTSIEHIDVILTHSQNIKYTTKNSETDGIDLTQSPEISEELNENFQNKDNLKSKKEESDNDNKPIIEMEIGNAHQSDIDLTQHSDSEEHFENMQNNYSLRNQSINVETEADKDATIEMEFIKSSQRCSSLGKKNDVSIDYDKLYDNLINQHSLSQGSGTSFKSATDHKSKDTSNCSQNSEVFVISDNELDYSMQKSKLDKPMNNFLLGGISIMDELPSLASVRMSTHNTENSSAAVDKNVLATENYFEANSNQIEVRTPVKHKRVGELATPQKPSCSGINTIVTPSNSQYVIKTLNVTPMPKYESMSIEELHSELDKFGVKPFKRKRAVQLLTHIYNQTHPTIEPYSDEESPCKRRKTDDYSSPQPSPKKHTPRKILSPRKSAKSPRKVLETIRSPKKVLPKKSKITKENVKNGEESYRHNSPEVIQISKKYEVDETPVIKEVHCSPDDWVFQKREKAKVHSCRVPLHVAFQNYVYSRVRLREAILCYEPINIDEIHKDLVAYGHRYDPKDLLKFMDKKCITVKTMDNDGRNQKR